MHLYTNNERRKMKKNESKEVQVKTGVSTGVKVGIGIGIGCLIVVIVLIVFISSCTKAVNNAVKTSSSSSPQSTSPTSESQKTYQEVFRFEGKDAKKSEPFNIAGSQFKVKYDCSGSLCQAWVKKAEPQNDMDKYYSQIIMNSAGNANSETMIYDGAGKYYIDVNSLATYTIIVYDYK